MRISIGTNRFLVSDEHQYWIVQERKGKDGKPYDVRLSGYYTTISGVLESYTDRHIRRSDIDSLKALDRKIEKLKREIRKWVKDDLGELK